MKQIMTLKGLFIVGLLLVKGAFAQEKAVQLPELLTIHAKDDSEKLLKNVLPEKGKIMLIFYDPGCGHCQELGESIDKNPQLLTNTTVFFITMYESELVDGYINMFAPGLKSKKNISFWHDPGVEFIEKLDPKNYPATYIYNAKEKKLIQDFQGENNVKKMTEYLK